MSRPGMLFGLNVDPSVAPGEDPVAAAQAAERLGFDFVSVNDHLHGPGPRHETWTLLSWLAASTSRIRVASRVLGLPYRNPAVLAKMAETLDRLSGGRLIMGLGAGASEEEFRAFGLPVGSLGDRISALEEALLVVRGLWNQPTFTFAGRHHHTEGAQLEPKPQRPIPIWLGTLGPRGLELSGRLADGWIPSLDLAPPERVSAMVERIRAAAESAGRDPDTLTYAYNLEVALGPGAQPGPEVVSGTVADVAEQLLGFTALGFNAFNFNVRGADSTTQAAQVESLALEVVPTVRRAA